MRLRVGTHWWVAVERTGAVVALLIGCRRRKHAERIARAVFPEIEAIHTIPWQEASLGERAAARQAIHVTSAMCRRAAIEPPPGSPPDLALTSEAARLQRRFSRTAAAGGRR